MSDVTRILSHIESGDPGAAEQLLPLVYDELRKLATARLAQERPGQTLQATALVHEAYLRLVGSSQESGKEPDKWNSRGHSARRQKPCVGSSLNRPAAKIAFAMEGTSKPTNVLVTLYDDKPVPKVIDFGVAKATGASRRAGVSASYCEPSVRAPRDALRR